MPGRALVMNCTIFQCRWWSLMPSGVRQINCSSFFGKGFCQDLESLLISSSGKNASAVNILTRTYCKLPIFLLQSAHIHATFLNTACQRWCLVKDVSFIEFYFIEHLVIGVPDLTQPKISPRVLDCK